MTLVGLAVMLLMGAALPTLPALLLVRGNATTGRGFMGPEKQGDLIFETALRSRWGLGKFDHFRVYFGGAESSGYFYYLRIRRGRGEGPTTFFCVDGFYEFKKDAI